MKYDYIELTSSGTIKNYEIKNDEITVHYFGGEKETKPYSSSFEKEIQNKMLQQARQRDEGGYADKILVNLNRTSRLSTTVCCVGCALMPFVSSKIVASLSVGVTYCLLDNYFDYYKLKRDYDKYHLFLRIQSDLDSQKESISSQVQHFAPNLNIHTIDAFTYGKVKQIYQQVYGESPKEYLKRKK